MRSPLRATAVLASGSAATLLVGLISAKVWALIVGPTGVGLLGLMLSVVAVGGILASMGIGTGLVREGASLRGRGDVARSRIVEHAAVRLTWILAILSAGAFVALRVPLGKWVLGGAVSPFEIVLLGLAVAISALAGIQTSLLNTHHRVGALARFAVLNSVLGATISLSVLWFLREEGIAYAVVSLQIVSWAVASWFVRRELAAGEPGQMGSGGGFGRAARTLVGFGIPFTASALIGSGVQFALPIFVLHLLDTESVGFYRAAVAISIGSFGFLLTAMGQDYYPRVSESSHDLESLRALVNQQLRLITMFGATAVIVGQALAPYLIPLIFSSSFAPAVPVLEWQMVGNLFKFWSWAMSFVILAHSGSRAFFFTEFVGGTVTIVATWVGVHFYGLVGLGVGYLLTCIIYFLVVWVMLRRGIQLVVSRENIGLMLVTLAGSGAVLLLPLTPVGALTVPFAVLFSAALFIVSGSVFWKQMPLSRGKWIRKLSRSNRNRVEGFSAD